MLGFWPLLARDTGGLAFVAPDDPETCALAHVSPDRFPMCRLHDLQSYLAPGVWRVCGAFGKSHLGCLEGFVWGWWLGLFYEHTGVLASAR